MSTLRALRSYTHLLILLHLCLCLIKVLPLMCSIVQLLLWSPSFNLHCVFIPAPLGKIQVLLLSSWMAHHLVSIHLLIAAGYGDHLGPAWYLAFIMPLCFKRALKHCRPSQRPQNICMILHQHSQEIKLTHQKKATLDIRDFFFYHYDYVSALCPLPSLLLGPAHLGVP